MSVQCPSDKFIYLLIWRGLLFWTWCILLKCIKMKIDLHCTGRNTVGYFVGFYYYDSCSLLYAMGYFFRLSSPLDIFTKNVVGRHQWNGLQSMFWQLFLLKTIYHITMLSSSNIIIFNCLLKYFQTNYNSRWPILLNWLIFLILIKSC